MKYFFNVIRKKSPFYKQLIDANPSANYMHLPIINKSTLMEHFEKINTAGISLDAASQLAITAEKSRDFAPRCGDVTVGLSSGTSGNKGLFLVSDNERYAWAGAILAKMLPDSLVKRQRIAFFLRANSNLYTTLGSLRIKFFFFDLLRDMSKYISRLNQIKPTILVAPPSILRLIAKFVDSDDLKINPTRIISVAEVLEPFDKQILEESFHQTVHQIYQATEGFIATSCAEGTLHLNEDLLFIEREYIDERKKSFVPIITDLYRFIQPIIRYRLNDVLTLKKQPCACGSVFLALAQIEGRCDDLLYGEDLDNQKLKPIFPDFIRRAIITAFDSIEQYRIIQTSPQKLQVQIQWKKNHGFSGESTLEDAISCVFSSMNCTRPTLEFETYTSPTKGEKLRRIIRSYDL